MAASMKPGRDGVALKAALVSLGLGFGLLTGEVLLRCYAVFSFQDELVRAFATVGNPAAGADVSLGDMIAPSPHRRIIFQLRPNLNNYFIRSRIESNNRSLVVTNSRGWRGRDYGIPKSNGTIRILGIGDSFMFGWGVDEGSQYPAVAEKLLNQQFPEATWEFVALASPGYNLPMEVEVLKEYGLAYEPDMIVYGYVVNDPCAPNFLLPQPDFFAAHSLVWELLFASAIFPKERSFIERNDAGAPLFNVCSPSEVPAAYRDLVGREPFYRALRQLVRHGRQLRIPVVLFSVSEPDDIPDLPEGLTTVYLPPEHRQYFRHMSRDYIPSVYTFSQQDKHPTIEGHLLLAQDLVNGLSSAGLLQKLYWSYLGRLNRSSQRPAQTPPRV